MLMDLNSRMIAAAIADAVSEGQSGRWTVKKFTLSKPLAVPREHGRKVVLPPRAYTQLYCSSKGNSNRFGDLVMDDTEHEVRKHLQFMRSANGRVLITGLGLGCVVRGCLANPAVREVVCIERSPDVLKLVAPSMTKDRLTIVEADAINWVPENVKRGRFDCAWHDIWSDPDKGEPALAVAHSRLLIDCLSAGIRNLGAWNFPREGKRCFRRISSARLS